MQLRRGMEKGSFLIFNMIARKILEEKITCHCRDCGENVCFCIPQHIYEWENKGCAKTIKKNLKKGIYGVAAKKRRYRKNFYMGEAKLFVCDKCKKTTAYPELELYDKKKNVWFKPFPVCEICGTLLEEVGFDSFFSGMLTEDRDVDFTEESNMDRIFKRFYKKAGKRSYCYCNKCGNEEVYPQINTTGNI